VIGARIQVKDPANGNWFSPSWIPQDSKETGSGQVGFHEIQRKLGQAKLDSTRFKGNWVRPSWIPQDSKELVDKELPCSVSNEGKILLIISQPS
jgi:hypothetical protein